MWANKHAYELCNSRLNSIRYSIIQESVAVVPGCTTAISEVMLLSLLLPRADYKIKRMKSRVLER